MAVVRVSAAIVHTAVLLAADTDYAASPEFGQVWVGATRAGASDCVIQGDADALERLALLLGEVVDLMRPDGAA